MADVWVGSETGILKGKLFNFVPDNITKFAKGTSLSFNLVLGIDLKKKSFQNYGNLSELSKEDDIYQMCWLNDNETEVLDFKRRCMLIGGK